jgi:hypothetical protein
VPPRSLADDLRRRSEDDLARLLTLRPDLLHPVPPDITALAARAASSTSVARTLDRLDAPSLAAAHALARMDEPATGERVRDILTATVPGQADDLFSHLRALAMLWGEDSSWRLVRAVRETLQSEPRYAVDWPPAPLVTTEHDPARVERTAGQHALASVMGITAIAEAWSGDDAPAVLRKGGLSVRDLTVTSRIVDLDAHRTALLLEAAYAAGLIGRDGDTDERWRPTTAYDDWHDSPLAEQWVALARAWLTMQRAPDRVDEGCNALSDDMSGRGLPLLREQVLRVLADLAPGCAPADVGEVVRGVDLAAPRHAGPLRAARVAAISAELDMLGFTGAHALAEMGRAVAGLVDVAPLDAASGALPEPVDHILVQADLTAVAPGPLEPELARQLRLMADVESTGGATVYRFTSASVRRAMDAGCDAISLLEFLTRVSRTPVPQPLGYLIEDAARSHGVVRIGVATAYIRCDDPATLAAVVAHPRSSDLGITSVAPTALAVGGRLEDAVALLRELGLHPVAEDPDGHTLTPTLRQRRAPAPPAPAAVSRRDATPALVRAAIATLQSSAGDTSSERVGLEPMAAADTVTVLRRAITESLPVWVAQGEDEYLVEPLRMSGGTLTAIDRITGQVRSVAVARLGAARIAD